MFALKADAVSATATAASLTPAPLPANIETPFVGVTVPCWFVDAGLSMSHVRGVNRAVEDLKKGAADAKHVLENVTRRVVKLATAAVADGSVTCPPFLTLLNTDLVSPKPTTQVKVEKVASALLSGELDVLFKRPEEKLEVTGKLLCGLQAKQQLRAAKYVASTASSLLTQDVYPVPVSTTNFVITVLSLVVTGVKKACVGVVLLLGFASGILTLASGLARLRRTYRNIRLNSAKMATLRRQMKDVGSNFGAPLKDAILRTLEKQLDALLRERRSLTASAAWGVTKSVIGAVTTVLFFIAPPIGLALGLFVLGIGGAMFGAFATSHFLDTWQHGKSSKREFGQHKTRYLELLRNEAFLANPAAAWPDIDRHNPLVVTHVVMHNLVSTDEQTQNQAIALLNVLGMTNETARLLRYELTQAERLEPTSGQREAAYKQVFSTIYKQLGTGAMLAHVVPTSKAENRGESAKVRPEELVHA